MNTHVPTEKSFPAIQANADLTVYFPRPGQFTFEVALMGAEAYLSLDYQATEQLIFQLRKWMDDHPDAA